MFSLLGHLWLIISIFTIHLGIKVDVLVGVLFCSLEKWQSLSDNKVTKQIF